MVNSLFPELEIDLDHILMINIEYLRMFEYSNFMHYMESSWDTTFGDSFWDIYERIKNTIAGGHVNINLEDRITNLTTIELYHFYVILIVYLKEHGTIDFLFYLESKWKAPLREYFWEIYYVLMDIISNYHSKIPDSSMDDLKPLHHYHILLILMDYLMTGGDPQDNFKGNEKFLTYLMSNWDEAIFRGFLGTIDNITQKLFDYYAN